MRQVRLDISHKLLLTLLQLDPGSLEIVSVWMPQTRSSGDQESAHYFSMLLTGKGIPEEFDTPEGSPVPVGVVEHFDGDDFSAIVKEGEQ